MWPTASRLVAAASLTLALALAASARARYGDVLRVKMQAGVRSLDPSEWPAAEAEAAAKRQLTTLVFEGLVDREEGGPAQPKLALSWRHDAARKRWQFRLRSGVVLHDGSPLTASVVASALHIDGAGATASGDSVVIQSDRAMPDLDLELARRRHAIAVRAPDGNWLGTGPFRVASFEPGRRLTLAAHDAHWAGRPFLDGVDLEMGRPLRDQQIDLELGRADLVEMSAIETRRAVQRGLKVWSSSPVELMALVLNSARGVDARIKEALPLAVDRAAIHSVLLQRQGEPAGAVFPQWMSGYAFLFPVERDLARARQILGATPASVSLIHDANDPLARSIGERIALNAREAGLTIRVASQGDAWDLRLARLRVDLADPLIDGLPALSALKPEALYAAERELVERLGLMPLFHVPLHYGLGSRVRKWRATASGNWRLEDVWLDLKP